MLDQADWLYMDGVFDLVHAGHFNAMRQAAQLSRYLCVGVNDDEETLELKGYAPIFTSAERAAIISACKWVDRVIDGTPYVTTLEYLREGARCAYVAHGDDQVATTGGADCYQEPRAAGRFKLFRRTDGISSTEITNRMQWAAQDVGILPRDAVCSEPPMPITTPLSSQRLVRFACPGRKGSPQTSRCLVEVRCAALEPPPALLKWCEAEQAAAPSTVTGRRVIYTQGAFDGLREEQIAFLETCKRGGDYLIVGVFSDSVCAALDPENHHCPILGVNDRMLNLLALRVVDEVLCNVTWRVDPGLLQAHKVSAVVLPANTPRIQRLFPAQDTKMLGISLVQEQVLGLSVNELRITLADFSRAASSPGCAAKHQLRCQKNASLISSRAETTTCVEI